MTNSDLEQRERDNARRHAALIKHAQEEQERRPQWGSVLQKLPEQLPRPAWATGITAKPSLKPEPAPLPEGRAISLLDEDA